MLDGHGGLVLAEPVHLLSVLSCLLSRQSSGSRDGCKLRTVGSCGNKYCLSHRLPSDKLGAVVLLPASVLSLSVHLDSSLVSSPPLTVLDLAPGLPVLREAVPDVCGDPECLHLALLPLEGHPLVGVLSDGMDVP